MQTKHLPDRERYRIIRAHLSTLPDAQQATILRQARRVVDYVKGYSSTSTMSEDGALSVVYALGGVLAGRRKDE